MARIPSGAQQPAMKNAPVPFISRLSMSVGPVMASTPPWNGLVLPKERGFPFEVAAEGKWGYKWAKWIKEIELSDNPDFRGYWESRGYSNDGDYPGPMFEKR